MRIRRLLVAIGIGALAAAGVAGPAMAEPPGPGDKQCVPGQHGNPHPGFKAGACTNP
jgi:hypothetical protein